MPRTPRFAAGLASAATASLTADSLASALPVVAVTSSLLTGEAEMSEATGAIAAASLLFSRSFSAMLAMGDTLMPTTGAPVSRLGVLTTALLFIIAETSDVELSGERAFEVSKRVDH